MPAGRVLCAVLKDFDLSEIDGSSTRRIVHILAHILRPSSVVLERPRCANREDSSKLSPLTLWLDLHFKCRSLIVTRRHSTTASWPSLSPLDVRYPALLEILFPIYSKIFFVLFCCTQLSMWDLPDVSLYHKQIFTRIILAEDPSSSKRSIDSGS